ncbi:restriction endonuclease subunit S [Neisseria sp. HMSC068C04]|uniref:restriction endonuclease subunit S n=1 Tax=Neisseria sp. HMSC068C04 TaxID=1715179 RepID=UPI0008A117E7|nr:restriction endonuclease subunit S [Neisseria sp. HMSC068C04]OFM34688.1 restriction endonuclease subunit S [Neisseria sp. HMSC068C04]
MNHFKKQQIQNIADFNPREQLSKGILAKSVPMAMLKEFQRQITGYEIKAFNGGAKFRNGDTLLAKITPCLENGKTAFVDILDDVEVAFGSTEFIVLRAKNETNPEFLYYFAISPDFRKRAIECMEGTSGRQRVNENTLKTLELPIPEPQTQQSIAAVLSALDKKIALNKQINARLEEMAKTLYDYWFVQFDFPDADGKPYKSSGGEMVFDETLKREIPKGWEVKSLNQVADIVMGQSPDGASYNLEQEGTIFFQGSTDFDWRFPNVRQYTTSPTRFAQKGDILLSVRAPVGDLNISPFECCIGRGLAALRSKSGNNSFLFYVMKYFKTVFERRNTEGTTFGSITKDDLHSLKLVAPADNVLEKYNEIASKYDEMIFIRSQQNHQLTQLRDFLLPMLMNGQVSVAE